MLKILGVSRSGYNSFLNRKVSPTRQRKDSVKKEIQKIYDNSKQNYGAPEITQELRKSGETISQRTVGKYMREMGIRAQWTKPWTTTTRDSDFSKELHNVLNEKFNPERPNAVWCTDITYIWTQDGFVYLNCVMDLYARKIIAWTLADTMEVSTVVETINKAKKASGFPSDRLEEMLAAFESFKKEALQRKQAVKKKTASPKEFCVTKLNRGHIFSGAISGFSIY